MSELQNHYHSTLLNNIEFYKNKLGIAGVSDEYIHITAKKFHEFEREGLLEHISKKLDKNRWHYEAMIPDGTKIIAYQVDNEVTL